MKRKRQEEGKNKNIITFFLVLFHSTCIHPFYLVQALFVNIYKLQNCTYMYALTLNNEHQPANELFIIIILFESVSIHRMNRDTIERWMYIAEKKYLFQHSGWQKSNRKN